jgi:hypothetical protein
MSDEVLRLLRDVTALYESRANSGLLSTIVQATLENALYEHVMKLTTALNKEFPNRLLMKEEKSLTKDGYEKLVGDEVLKYKAYLLKAFPSSIPTTAACAVQEASLQFLTLDGAARIVDSLLKEGRIAEVGYKSGLMQYVCVDTNRDEPAVVIEEKKDEFALTPTISDKYLKVIEHVLKGNKYQLEDEIYRKVCSVIVSAPADLGFQGGHLDKTMLHFALIELQKQGRVVLKYMYGSGNGLPGPATWKKPIKKYTKMKKFEWKKMIVEVLDMHKGAQLTHREIVGALKHQYTLGSPPEELHGSIGSALDRLSKDGKLKRFHRKKVKKGYVYWTTPVAKPLPLPKPRGF